MTQDRGGLRFPLEVVDQFTGTLQSFRDQIRALKAEMRGLSSLGSEAKGSRGRRGTEVIASDLGQVFDKTKEVNKGTQRVTGSLKKQVKTAKAANRSLLKLYNAELSARRRQQKRIERLSGGTAFDRKVRAESRKVRSEEQAALERDLQVHRELNAERRRAIGLSSKQRQLTKDFLAEEKRVNEILEARKKLAHVQFLRTGPRSPDNLRNQLNIREDTDHLLDTTRYLEEATRQYKKWLAKAGGHPGLGAYDDPQRKLVNTNDPAKGRSLGGALGLGGDSREGPHADLRRTRQEHQKMLKQVQHSTRAWQTFNKQLSSTNSTTNRISFSFRRLIGIMAAFTVARQVTQQFHRLISSGLRFNSVMEQSKFGIAGIVSATAELADQQGRLVAGSEKYRKAQLLAVRQQEELKKASLATTATYEELLLAFQVAAGPGIAAGFNLDEVRKFSVYISQAASAIGLQQNQLSEEIRALLTGNIRSTTTRIAQVLSITNEDVRRAKEAGNLYGFLETRLKGFSLAARDAARTVSGASSRLSGAMQVVLGEASLDAYGKLRLALNQLVEQLLDVRRANGEIEEISANSGLAAAFRHIYEALGGVVDYASRFTNQLSNPAGIASVAKLFEGLGATLEWIGKLILDLVEVGGRAASTLGSIFIGVGEFASSLLQLVGVDTGLRDILKTMAKWAAVLLGVKLALGLILAPVFAVAKGFLRLAKTASLFLHAVKNTGPLLKHLVGQGTKLWTAIQSAALAMASGARSALVWLKTSESVTAAFARGTLVIYAMAEGVKFVTSQVYGMDLTWRQFWDHLNEGYESFYSKVIAGRKRLTGVIQEATGDLLGSEQLSLSGRESQAVADQIENDADRRASDFKRRLKAQQAEAEKHKKAMERLLAGDTGAADELTLLPRAKDLTGFYAATQEMVEQNALRQAALKTREAERRISSLSANQEERQLALEKEKLKALKEEVELQNVLAGDKASREIAKLERGLDSNDPASVEATQARVRAIREGLLLTESEITGQYQDQINVVNQLARRIAQQRREREEQRIKDERSRQETIRDLNQQLADQALERSIEGLVGSQDSADLAAENARVFALKARLAAERQLTQQKKQQFIEDQKRADSFRGYNSQNEPIFQTKKAMDEYLILVRQRALAEGEVTSALQRQIAVEQQAFLRQHGTYGQGLSAGFLQFGNEFASQYQAALDVAYQATNQFAAFVAESITSAFDPNNDQSIKERFGRFLQSIANLILTHLAQVAIARIILGGAQPAQGGGQLAGVVGSLAGAAAGGFAKGGQVGRRWPRGYASGGSVLGHGMVRPTGVDRRDTEPIWAQPGEFVMRLDAVKKYGTHVMHALNNGMVNPNALPAVRRSAARRRAGPGYATGGEIVSAAGQALSQARGSQAGSGDTLTVAPVMLADDATMSRMLSGGKRSFLRHMRDNKDSIKTALEL